jgi:hypothetical protein
MANDIDMWNDIQRLKRVGRKGISDAMMKVYKAWFIEGNKKEAQKAILEAWKKHRNFYFDFSGYGISEPSYKKLLKVI